MQSIVPSFNTKVCIRTDRTLRTLMDSGNGVIFAQKHAVQILLRQHDVIQCGSDQVLYEFGNLALSKWPALLHLHQLAFESWRLGGKPHYWLICSSG